VGPNGSGKSNISDAISWVMGEQSARTLRGSKMEDVIFIGTEKRNPVGFAQVTLILDNSDGTFPGVESSEVMVTRRYYRSGESEYYINKQSVRLRDINELFMDTGLGREGYALIGQGRIDEILSQRSADRREIFEEAAGISKYRHRKEEAERKLERTEENLVRIGDKIAELELQVEPLRAQAETAKRYLILRDELRLLEISVWLEKIDEIKANALKLRADCAAARLEKERADAELEALYAENEQFSLKVQENDLEQERVRVQMQSVAALIAEEENAVAVQEAGVQHNRSSIELLEREIAEQDERTGSLREQIEEQQRRIAEIDSQTETLQQEIDALLAKARDAAQNAGSAAQEADALRAKETLAVAEAADARSRLSAALAGIEQMTEREGSVARDIESANERLELARKEERTARRALEDAQDEASSVANIIQGHRLRLDGRVKREESCREAVNKLAMEQNNMHSRIDLLSEMEKEYAGFNKSVRTVMQSAQSHALRGIHGPVASLVRVDKRCAVALEIALGAGMQNIVVDNEENAKSAINYLKQRDAGRATFLPLSAIRGNELTERGLEQEQGFVGLASRLAEYDAKYENIFRDLLGRTVIVEDMDCAVAMARKYQQRFRIVTLDGQIVNRGGSMTGGSVSQSAGILSRANELESLKKNYAQVQEKLAAAQKELDDVTRESRAAQYEMEVAEGQRRRAEDAVLRHQGEVDRHRAMVENLSAAVENLEGEQLSLAERLKERRALCAEIEREISEKEQSAAAIRAQVEQKLAGQSDLNDLSGKLTEDLTACREKMAALNAERQTTEQAAADLRQVRADMELDRVSRTNRLAEYRAVIESAEQEIARCSEKIAQLRMQNTQSGQELAALREAKMQLEQERNSMNQRLRACNDSVQLTRQALASLENKLTSGQWEEQQLLEKLWETYELSHSAASEQRIELESVVKANRRIGELKREINALGHVNVGAIEEFDRVNTRYTYLSEQRDDVEKAKGDLLGIIEGLTGEMTTIFAQQFALIQKAFQETFVDLFGGGHAALELEDPKNILDCGIEIKVQPPGKTLKTITLLSGGEKAFVAIALYFAILKVHPTPFCVMDEIEAALDDANVVRYADYMRTIADKTQFIVITHRRGTMEEADVLYGVTMQEKGVSKMLQLDLNDMEKELKLK
ncbi:MAG: chromosome segregation protein SMC, partial [Oscillospiraceae bacterium]|nr:chromosome segregation protein SMC [Oscillospiraceae bacterium]